MWIEDKNVCSLSSKNLQFLGEQAYKTIYRIFWDYAEEALELDWRKQERCHRDGSWHSYSKDKHNEDTDAGKWCKSKETAFTVPPRPAKVEFICDLQAGLSYLVRKDKSKDEGGSHRWIIKSHCKLSERNKRFYQFHTMRIRSTLYLFVLSTETHWKQMLSKCYLKIQIDKWMEHQNYYLSIRNQIKFGVKGDSKTGNLVQIALYLL
jgi:hypothetical protein